LWVAKVEPRMAEIRELIRQHSYLRELADRATANTGLASIPGSQPRPNRLGAAKELKRLVTSDVVVRSVCRLNWST